MRCFLTCELDPSVVSFLPGLALMKTTVFINAHTFHISGWIYLIMGEQRMNAEHARIAKQLRDERMRVIYVRK